MTRPNFIVLVADDHRGTELSHLPHAQAKTPVLDSLAARGTSFSQAHCQGSMIKAVCAPSRACLMTGRDIFAATNDPTGASFQGAISIRPELETFPQGLRAAGYHTHAVGKWHNDAAAFQRSFSGGNAIMFLGMSDHDKVPVWDYDPDGNYQGANSYNFDEPHSDEDEQGNFVIREGFSTDIFADAAIDFLHGYEADDPFLLYVAFTAPHDPRTPPAGWEVDPADVELPPNLLPEHPFDNGELRVRDETLAGFPRDEGEIRQHLADYYGMIAHLDDAVGRILQALEASGLADDTIVVYTADHGISIGQHGLMGKQSLYEHSLRVPLVMAGPGVPHGVVADDLVWHADTNATIRALAGVEADPAAEGATLIGDDEIVKPRSHFGAAYGYAQRMYRDDRYKLIRYTPTPEAAPGFTQDTLGSDMVQLFDLESDLWEMENLAGNEDYAAIRQELERGLDRWQVEVNDALLQFT